MANNATKLETICERADDSGITIQNIIHVHRPRVELITVKERKKEGRKRRRSESKRALCNSLKTHISIILLLFM